MSVIDSIRRWWSGRKLYEVTNPSAPLTIELRPEHELAACVGILLISNAMFGVRRPSRWFGLRRGTMSMPSMLLGKADTWLPEHGIPLEGLNDWILEHRLAIADALDSIVVAHDAQRASAAPSIVRSCQAYAAKLRKMETGAKP